MFLHLVLSFKRRASFIQLKVKFKSVFLFLSFRLQLNLFLKKDCNYGEQKFVFSMAKFTASSMAATIVITVENRKATKKQPKPQSQIARARRAGAVASVPPVRPSCRPPRRQTRRRRPHERGGWRPTAPRAGGPVDAAADREQKIKRRPLVHVYPTNSINSINPHVCLPPPTD